MFDSSAYCATIRNVFRSPLPPIITGMRPTGGGLLIASITWYRAPSSDARSPRSIGTMICSASSSFSKRSVKVPNSIPNERCSSSNQPAPMPSCARPADTMSSVVTVFASTAGLRYVLPVTRAPRRTLEVSRARADSSE